MIKKKKIDEKNLLKILKKIFKNSKNLSVNSKSKDIQNWDSMNHIMMIMEVNKYYKINIKLEDSVKIDSIKKLIKTIEKYKK
jgi:acyl carrier protein|tara:strand:+ start:6567 stop:6812 length:246 start_codon:yes stop_codon:yes gene_type:complete